MAKAAILDVLESTIGRYVQNLDASALNVALWSGKIELHSLELDIGAVNSELTRQAIEAPNLAIPFRVLQGNFESLRVEVPWAKITSRPVVFRAKGLNILVEPFDHLSSQNQNDYLNNVLFSTKNKSQTSQKRRKDVMESTKIDESKKINTRLQSLEIAEESRQRGKVMRKLANLDGVESLSGDVESDADTNSNSKRKESSSGFTARLVRRIIENLQVELDGIHLAMKGGGCAAGIILEHLSLITTDSKGKKTYIDRAHGESNKSDNSFLYKALSIKGLGIYCDEIAKNENENVKIKHTNIYQEQVESQPTLSDKCGGQESCQKDENSYILTPLSFEAKLRQSDSLQCKDFPKYLLSSSLSSLSIMLTRTQLELMQNISQEISNNTHLDSHPLFPEYRPSVKLTRSTAKLWWRYAVRAIGRINRRRSWTEFIIAYRKRKSYLILYKRNFYHETCPWLMQLNTNEIFEMEKIENDRSISVQGIMNWRNIGDGQVEIERQKHEANINSRRLKQQHQLPTPIKPSGRKDSNVNKKPSSGSRYDKEERGHLLLLDRDDEDHLPIRLTVEEMKVLESTALENATDETTDLSSTDSKLYDMNFTLESFNICLITFDSRPLASLEMGAVKTSFLTNADGSFVASYSLSSLNVFDRATSNSLFPRIVQTLQSSAVQNSIKTSATAGFGIPTSTPCIKAFDNAIEVVLTNSKKGDRDLTVKVAALEFVFPFNLLEDFKRFVTFSGNDFNMKKKEIQTDQNLFLHQSVSRGAGVIYDEVSNKLQSALTDAWRNRFKEKSMFSVELDIQAPIFILPESCVDFKSTVLIADLGNFHLTFGNKSHTESLSIVNISGERIEVYTAQGLDLDSPVQILEPLEFIISMKKSSAERASGQSIDISISLSNVDCSISIQNVALVQSILSTMNESLSLTNAKDEDGFGLRELSEKDAAHIEKMAAELDKTGDLVTDSSPSTEGSNLDEEGTETQNVSHLLKSQALNWNLTLNITLPQAVLMVINDMQGLDQALFKVIVRSFVFGADFTQLQITGVTKEELSKPKLMFHIHMNTSIMADYFDSHTNFWEPLLEKQWELSFRATRGISKRFKSTRMATTVDIESQPCSFSFSEQFLISLGGASSMWSVYSIATKKATALCAALMDKEVVGNRDISEKSSEPFSVAKSLMAKSLMTTLPYGIENHSGLMVEFEIEGEREKNQTNFRYGCPSGTIQYFRFHPARRNGFGGWRSYGQDLLQHKSICIFVDGCEIYFHHLDEDIKHPRRVHQLGLGRHIFSDVVKAGKTTLIHLSSYIDIRNETSFDFRISLKTDNNIQYVGLCKKKGAKKSNKHRISKKSFTSYNMSKSASTFGIPIDLLQNDSDDKDTSLVTKSLIISSSNTDNKLTGIIALPPLDSYRQMVKENMEISSFEVTCSSTTTETMDQQQNCTTAPDKMVIQVYSKITLVGDNHPFVDIFLQPRTILQNKMHINVLVRTPMSHTISNFANEELEQFHQEITHKLTPFDSLEMYTPGPSIAVTIKCADPPTVGLMTGWNHMGWIDIPLGHSQFLKKRIDCIFPFVNSDSEKKIGGGSEFFIAEPSDVFNSGKEIGTGMEKEKLTKKNYDRKLFLSDGGVRKVFLSNENLGVDHTGELLFEPVFNPKKISKSEIKEACPLSAFSSSFHKHNITLLPRSTAMIRLLKINTDGSDGFKRSLPVRIENISLCEGGLDSSSIFWEDKSQSGYFAYRKLSTYNQSEIHVIPEYVVFNGSGEEVKVIQSRGNVTTLTPGQMAPIYSIVPDRGLITMFDFINYGGMTSPLRVDLLGLKVSIVRSSLSGSPIGSLAIQTVIGNKDSRFVIKLGAITHGGSAGMKATGISSKGMFDDDFLRFRIKWPQMEMTLNDTAHITGSGMLLNQSTLDRHSSYHMDEQVNEKDDSHHSTDLVLDLSRNDHNKKSFSYSKVASILFDRFTVDFQRIYKEDEKKRDQDKVQSPERSQLSIIIHNVLITDFTEGKGHAVLKSYSTKSNVFDLCIRMRGSDQSDLVNVDLFDLKLACTEENADPIVIDTNEAFLWSLLDIASRTNRAKAELAGTDVELDWDDATGEFIISTTNIPSEEKDNVDEDGEYHSPTIDQLYKIRTARVSPFLFLVSFKRRPLTSRYQSVQNVRGAGIVNYFTTKLKFTIKKAELRFQGYSVRDLRGPADRLFEEIKAFYVSSLKRKILRLLTATSLGDREDLTGQDKGNDEHVEGDIMPRSVGIGAGKLLHGAGKRVGQVFSGVVDWAGLMTAGDKKATLTGFGENDESAGLNPRGSGSREGIESGDAEANLSENNQKQ